jgi:hypothetical protein
LIVTSAAVPAVVGTAIVKTACFFGGGDALEAADVGELGFETMTPMALAVSMEEPPPMATMQSAPEALKARTPVWTFSMVGLGLMLE